MLRVLAACILALGLLLPTPASARCAPKQTLRIVYSMDAPDLPKDHFFRQTRTLYRSGDQFGRMEERPNPETGLHLLIVVNGADIWMANRADKTGEHAIDPGPVVAFHAPLIGELKSEYWTNLEFGCEVAFMEAVKSVPRPVEGSDTHVYEHTAEGTTVQLFVGKSGLPERANVQTKDETFSFIYHAYEQITEPDPALFVRPIGIRFTEAEAHAEH
jgi:hypothetical protein